MNRDRSIELHAILQHAMTDDDLLCQHYADLIKTAVEYARIRVDWQLLDREGRRGIEPRRTATHDAFIDACNILSRAMKKKGLDTSWREQLRNDRREIGDFSCYLHLYLGIKAR